MNLKSMLSIFYRELIVKDINKVNLFYPNWYNDVKKKKILILNYNFKLTVGEG